MGLVDGKVAIVTGAGGGIGRCHALLLAAEGAKVVVNDLGSSVDGSGASVSMAQQVVDEIKAAGGEAVANGDSVATREGAEGILNTALETYGRADILVNNAGILRDKTLLKLEEANFDLVVQVHMKGTFLCTQAFARHVKERAETGDEGGRVINTSSYAGLKGNYGQTNYSAAKAGIYGMTLTWSQELAKLGVTVNCLAPMAKTRMTDDIAMVPDSMQPEQVAPMVLFLASDLAKDVNGRVFGIHGQQLLEYTMLMTDGATKEGDALWTPTEIAERLKEIAGQLPKPSPAAGASKPAGPAEIISQAFQRMPEVFVPARAKGWNAVIHFDITDGTPYTVTVKDGACTTGEGKTGDATCVVTVDQATYADVVMGKQKAEQAFMAGKIKATNLGDMMKFGSAFDMKKAKQLAEQAAASSAAPAAPKPAGPAEIIAQAFQRMPEVFVPARAKGWNAVIHFDITDGTPYTVTVKDGACTTGEGKTGDATCVVTVDQATYADVVMGKQKAEQAFMAGKIKATNLGDMMKFGSAFDMKKAKQLAEQAAASSAAPAAPKPAGPAEIIAQAFQRMPEVFVPARAKGWNAVIHFDITDGTPYTVTVKDGACTTGEGKTGDATCVVTVDQATYADVVMGKQKAEQAFMAGKIKATNLGDMMKFGSAFDMKKAKQLAEQAAKPAAAASGAPAAGPAELVTRAFTRLPETFRPEKAGGWSACVQFHLEGGEDWTVEVKDGEATTTPGRQGTATCVVATTLEDYAQILSGELKAEQAFVQGRIKPSNVGELMKFGSAFDLKRVAELIREAGSGEAASGGLNRDMLGHVRRAREPLFVRPEQALAFGKATLDENPAYEGDEAIAPPMFAVRLFKDLLFDLVSDSELGADVLRLVHGEQDMEFLRPLRPWDLCALRCEVTGMERKSSGELLRLEERLYTGGELAVRVGASMFIRGEGGGKTRKPNAEASAEPAPTPLFEETISVPEGQSLLYADASGDNNPIHTDPEVAKLAGFPGVILQGLCTMSFAAKTLVDRLGEGDPTRLKRLGVRFSKPVLIGDVLTISAWNLDATEGRQVYGVSVRNQDGVEVIQNGRAEIGA